MNKPQRVLEFGPTEITVPESAGNRALRSVVLPILVIQHDGRMHAIGTCFVVSGTGRDAIALTAKHNIEYVMQIDGSRDIHAPTTPPEFRVVHFQRRTKNLTAFVALWVSDEQMIPCNLVHAWFVETSHDLAAVLLKIPDRHNAMFTQWLKIDSRGPLVGDRVRAAGYREIVIANPREDEDGVIGQQSLTLLFTVVSATVTRSYHAGEQRLVKGPCVELDCALEHGMSRGPIFTVDDRGAVIACAMVTSGTSYAPEGIGSLLYPQKRFDALYADGPNVLAAGSITPRGAVKVVDGGYEINGRWPFASGCKHCQWLIASGLVMENGAPRPSSIPGVPQSRSALVPAERATIFDTWSVSGLKGTGSHDFEVQALQIPEEDTFDPFFGQPSAPGPLYKGFLTQASLHMAAVAVGIAQHAIDDITALAIGQKRRSFTRVSMAETPLFQYRLGHAETTLRAARAALRAEAEEFWALVVSGRAPGQSEHCLVAGTAAWVAETAAAVVTACYTAGGATALYETSPLQRHLRDIHTLTQHIMVAEGWLTKAGAALLGQEVGFGL